MDGERKARVMKMKIVSWHMCKKVNRVGDSRKPKRHRLEVDLYCILDVAFH